MINLPEGWVETKFADVADIKLGKMLDDSKNQGEPTPYLRNINVRWGHFQLDDVANMRVTAAERAVLAIHDGDLIVCEGGEPGRSAVWSSGANKFAFQKALMRVRSFGGVEPHLLAAFLRRAHESGQLEQHFTGTTIKHLPKEALSAIAVPLPPLAEQRRIVARIDSLSSKSKRARDHLDHIPRLVEKYKQVVLAAAFQGDLTREWRADTGKPQWTTITVGSVIRDIEAGKNLRCEERPPKPHERGVVKVSAVTWGIFDPQAAKTLPSDFNPPENSRIRIGDLLISRANTLELVGAAVIVEATPPNLYLSDKVLRLEMDEADKRWLLWFLRSPAGRSVIEAGATGNQLSMRNLSQAALKNIELPWPGFDERMEIVRRIEVAIDWIDRLAADATSAHTLIGRLDHAVLAKAFRGELVAQDPADEPASVLLERIAAERGATPNSGRGRKKRQ